MSVTMLRNARCIYNKHEMSAYDFDEFDVASNLVKKIRKSYRTNKALHVFSESDAIELSLIFNSKVFTSTNWDNFSV